MSVYRLLLIISLSLFTYSLGFSQGMLKEGNQWNVFSPAQFCPQVSTRLLRVFGDTIISNETYTTFISSRDTVGGDWQLLNIFLREDTTGKIFLRESFGEEYLLYDFGLEVGGTYVREDFGAGCNLQVVEVDSITLNNGEQRKRLQLAEDINSFRYTWIEGIGAEFGPFFNNYCLLDVNTFLICFSEQDELLYPENPEFCFRTTSVSNTLPSDISIYPNPMSDLLYITHGSTQLQSISIVNLNGSIFYEKPYTEFVDVSQFPKGIYIILLEDDRENIFSDKLVKMG